MLRRFLSASPRMVVDRVAAPSSSSKILSRALSSSTKATTSIKLQLDYFMSSQFAGVAVALQDQLYTKAGLNVKVLPNVEPGQEPSSVLATHSNSPDAVCVGTIEQNVLFPCVVEQGAQVTAVASLFGRSPLCLASLPSKSLTAAKVASSKGEGLVVGAHVDTVDLLQRIMPKAKVISVPRDEKMSMLVKGQLDAVQVYDVMEPLALEAQSGQAPVVMPLSACTTSMMELGYSQVVFVPTSTLQDSAHKAGLHKFLEVTFAGWQKAIAKPEEAARAVMALQPPNIDHWVHDLNFTATTVDRCCEYVKMSRMGPALGVLDPAVWQEANKWLAGGCKKTPDPAWYPAMDNSVWGVDPRLMTGDGLARQIVSGVRRRVQSVATTQGRAPSLVVITVGEEAVGGTHWSAQRRLQLYAPKDQSWFDKTAMGKALGIDVEEVTLPASTTNAQLMAEIRKHAHKDGVQLMWPLPPHIDSLAAYSLIRPDQDVDGAFYLGRMELAGGQAAAKKDPSLVLKNAPVTPSAVVRMLDHYKVDVKAKRVVIVGRSRLVGQPLAYMLQARGALVTMVHTDLPEALMVATCKEADILIPCAGHVGLVTPAWVKDGAVVINVGTSFRDDELYPDIPKELQALPQARLVASCPGGVGPLSAAVLFEQVANSALAKSSGHAVGGATESTPSVAGKDLEAWLKTHPEWTLASPAITKRATPRQVLLASFSFPTFDLALGFVSGLGVWQMQHHPNLSLEHHCTAGATVTVELFTLSTGTITDFDLQSADQVTTFYHTMMGTGQGK